MRCWSCDEGPSLPPASITKLPHRAVFKTDFRPLRSESDTCAVNVRLKQRPKRRRFRSPTGFRGEADMTARFFSITPAMALASGAATALAQPVANRAAQVDQASDSTPLRPDKLHNIVQLIFRSIKFEGHSKDYEFSASNSPVMAVNERAE
jgi:Patatin phospholipase